MPAKKELPPAVRRLISDAGDTTQSLGLGRVIGKIFAYLYFSPTPRCLGDIHRDLAISKGSASMGVRQLEKWEAVRKVSFDGDRKDYFEACEWFGRIIKRALVDTFNAKMTAYEKMLDQVRGELAPPGAGSEYDAFLRGKIDRIQGFQHKVASFWDNPLVRALLR
jgi:DNA-binding transcriptional regulator GbsR (MarR family)